ncbi:hypothetical protein [Ottowia testudinis]|uniref:Uncharacterized protein n=1 Tax=Ottowia testudinis TaxID=2816950 RepID=A0A975H3J7_9BURK|nr:hypothetical protein [Ottowia testudinis]QTD45316.1 hypothetical protein J1M35_20265 [Ottowia testudinis]
MNAAEREQEVLRHRTILVDANKAMLDVLYSMDWLAPEFVSYHPYEKRDLLSQAHLGLSGEIARSDYGEVVNRFNAWVRHTASLLAWNNVLASVGEEDGWSVYLEFVEPVVFFCFHQPTSFRDAMVRYATHVVHAANVASGYTADWLPEDDKKKRRLLRGASNPNKVSWSRQEKERQLKNISAAWSKALHLIHRLEQLDDENHRIASRDWRNESAHSIPSHINVGMTHLWRRSICFRQELVDQPDGRARFETHKDKFSVAYDYGGRDAIPYATASDLNLHQLRVARDVMHACDALIDEICQVVGPRKDASIEL